MRAVACPSAARRGGALRPTTPPSTWSASTIHKTRSDRFSTRQVTSRCPRLDGDSADAHSAFCSMSRRPTTAGRRGRRDASDDRPGSSADAPAPAEVDEPPEQVINVERLADDSGVGDEDDAVAPAGGYPSDTDDGPPVALAEHGDEDDDAELGAQQGGDERFLV